MIPITTEPRIVWTAVKRTLLKLHPGFVAVELQTLTRIPTSHLTVEMVAPTTPSKPLQVLADVVLLIQTLTEMELPTAEMDALMTRSKWPLEFVDVEFLEKATETEMELPIAEMDVQTISTKLPQAHVDVELPISILMEIMS